MQNESTINLEISEKWVPVKGWEDIYEVSNKSRVRSKKRCIINTRGRKYTLPGIILKGSKNKEGYPQVSFSNGVIRKKEWFHIHRLVAIHFIPNPDNKPFVNHINGIRHDNRIENLEWVTESENSLHAVEIGLKKIGKAHRLSKQIRQYDIHNKFIAEYESINIAAKATGICNAGISLCVSGKFKQIKGFIFKSS